MESKPTLLGVQRIWPDRTIFRWQGICQPCLYCLWWQSFEDPEVYNTAVRDKATNETSMWCKRCTSRIFLVKYIETWLSTSKRVIFVLSSSFLRNNLCLYILQMAKSFEFLEQQNVIIILKVKALSWEDEELQKKNSLLEKYATSIPVMQKPMNYFGIL